MRGVHRHLWRVTVFLTGLLAAAQLWGQPGDPQSGPLGRSGGIVGLLGQGGGQPVVSVSAQFTAPGPQGPSRLFITATIEPGWYIYSLRQAPGGPSKTEIRFQPSQSFRLLGQFEASPPPQKKREPAFDNLVVESHHGRVTWHAPIEFAPRVDPASLKIEGYVRAQPCDPSSCRPPTDFQFTAEKGPGVELAEPPAELPQAKPEAAKALNLDALVIAENEQIRQSPMWLAVAMGLLGGLILNVMPCVLPVIGLKILSFVEQAGQSRRRALMLNVWYSLGLLSVFIVLATLAVSVGLGWGALFSFRGFKITLAAMVFVMGLSFLGIWEIPIPGFVGSGKAVELTQQEGVAGAFAKGVLTTILATPCSAPFLAPALTWAVSQPPLKTYAVFTAVGLGMASPYLLIGAFPKLIRFLPKPGAWMDTFKQIMGFVLFGTVVFILMSLPSPSVVPTVGLLFGLWAACWWIGRTPPTAALGIRLQSWVEATAFAGLVWIITFGWLSNVMQGRFDTRLAAASSSHSPAVVRDDELPWQPFSKAALEASTAAGKTVLVDFTADWCLTCKTLEATVLNTRRVRTAVKTNGVVVFQADWTHGAPEVTEVLDLLGGKQVPVIAIFPAGDPNQPLIFRGGYTQQMILDALEKAGPSIGG